LIATKRGKKCVEKGLELRVQFYCFFPTYDIPQNVRKSIYCLVGSLAGTKIIPKEAKKIK